MMLVIMSLCLLALASSVQAKSSNKVQKGVGQCIDNDALTTETFAAIENAIKVSQYGQQTEKLKALNRLEKHVGNMRPIIMAEEKPKVKTFADCLELLESGTTRSGVYTITPNGTSVAVQVYCDMITDGGGWTVFQRRQDGSENFDRDFMDYSQGFGNKDGEFWLGNDALRNMTANGNYELRIDMWDWENSYKYATYEGFAVTGEDYQLSFTEGSYDGTAGDSLAFHNGWGFTTKDHDVDGATGAGNCAVWLYSGWWFNFCHRANLNGRYKNQLDAVGAQRDQGIQWTDWKGFEYSLKKAEMKFRRAMTTDTAVSVVAANCAEVEGVTSGVYTVNPTGMEPIDVYCDMDTSDGGWTVFQRRENGATDFERNFNDYAEGFGELGEDFWLGNNALKSMTDPSVGSYKLRIDMWDWAGNHSYAEYSDFSITGDNFVLGIGEYGGDAGDSLTFHNGMGFTTIDHDVDEATGGNCAEWLHGGWWYNYCHRANLNGRYREIDAVDGERDQGIQWVAWKGFNYSLKKVEMKFKPFYNDY
ncbi:fibrinogen C domain-containing protein 1-like [Asterias rubens]|uniref:fibrinogen C domain-containing protein 1-like n=1 Tax=Asterias rubens TaxID=7604 RepID=UPI001455621C|nr:fibrinogen C domain-containing protein 1-like [Asterias rubens]